MREPIENEYFNWLCAKVVDSNSHNYLTLLIILHKTEFIWTIPADENRAEEGLELRNDFILETNSEFDSFWMDQPCSVLEMLIAFAKRALFQTDIPVRSWFEEFMTNLGLSEFRRVSDSEVPLVENIIHNFLWRNYDFRGNGGLFPMTRTNNDQRKVELWYQFNEYIDDRGLI